jgi:hypothetical protein
MKFPDPHATSGVSTTESQDSENLNSIEHWPTGVRRDTPSAGTAIATSSRGQEESLVEKSITVG